MNKSVAQKEEKWVSAKLLELVYRRFSLTFWSTLLVSGGLVATLWGKVKPETLLVWLLALWLVAGVRQFFARRYLAAGQDNAAGQENWRWGMLLGAAVAGACWGATVYLFPSASLDETTMLLLFVIAGVAGFACVSMAAEPRAAIAFMLFALGQPAFHLFSLGGREYYFMGGLTLVYLALMAVFVRQMHNAICSSLTTTEQNKELSAALAEVKSLKYAAAQKESERRYQELFANFEDSILFIDVGADGKFAISSLNPAAERTFGIRSADVRGKSKFDLFPADLAERLVEYDMACVESGRPLSYEDVLELPSGKRYFSVTQIPMRDASGRVSRIAAISRDITERKQMEEAIAAREREFRTLAENAPDPIFRYDRECRRIYANSMVERNSGISLEKLLGQTPTGSALVPSPESVKVQQSVRRVLDTGEADEVEVLFVAPDGREIYFQNIHVPEFAADGSVQSVLSMGRDVTARKYMESTLLKSEREYRMLAENSPDNIVRFDRELRVRYLNKNLESAVGMPAGYLLGKTLAEVFADGIFDELEVTLKKVAESGQSCDHYQSMPDTGKGERFHHLRIAPERDEHGSVSGILVIGRDITERKRVEQSLEKTGWLLNSVLQGIPDPVWMKDADGKFVVCNNGVARLFNMKVEDIIGKDDYDFFEPEQAEFYQNKDRTALEAGTLCINEEWWTFGDNGERALMETRKVPVRSPEGQLLGVLGVARDITARKQMEAMLQEKHDSLQEAQRIGHIGSWDVDMVNDRLTWSDETFRIWEVDKEKFAATFEAFLNTVHPEDQERVARVYNESIEQRKLYEVEHRLLFPDGRIKHVLERGEPYFDEDGKPVRFVGTSLEITERKQAEAKQQELERQLQMIADNLPGAFNCYRMHADFSGQMLYANKGMYDVFGLTLDDLRDTLMPMAERMHPDDLVAASEKITEASRTLSTFTGEFRVNHPDKGEIWVRQITTPVYESESSMLYYGMMFDITERKRMEEQMAAREREFRSLAGNIPDNIARWDAEGRYLYVNPTHERLLGSKLGELVGQLIPDSHAHVQAGIAQVVATGQAIHAMRQAVMGDGVEELHDVSLVPEFDETGKLVSVLGMGRNMTERYRLMETLSAREQEFRSLAESSPDNIIRYDLEHRMLYLNAGLVRLLGLSGMEEVIGKRPIEVWTDGRFDPIEQAATRAIETGEKQIIDLIGARANGELGYNQIFVVPERDANGDIIGTIAFGRDVTDLRATERLMQMIGDHMPGALTHYRLRADLSGELLYASRGLKDIYGYTREDLADGLAPMIARIHPDDLPKAVAEQEHAANTLTTAVSEFRVNHPEKGEIWVQQITTPLPDADGSMLWYSLMFDISERKRMEDALAERQAFLDSLFEAIPVPVFYKDREGRYLGFNRAYETVFGASRERLIGKSVFETHPRELAETYHAKDAEIFERRVALQQYEFQIRHADGTLRDVLFSKAAFNDARGEVDGLIGAVIDITERKKLEASLRGARDFLRHVMDGIADPIFVKDRQHNWIEFNDAFCSMLGLPREQMLGKSDYDFLPEEQADVFWDKDELVFSSGETNINEESITGADGELRHIQTKKMRVHFESEGGDLLIGVIRDITERKQAEVALRASEALAQSRNELLQAIVESSPEIIVFALDTDYRYLSFNQKHKVVMQAIWGKEIAVGMNMLEVIGDHPDRNSAQRGMDRALAGESFVIEEAYGDEALSRQYWQNYWSPIRSDAGKVVGVTCFVLNITERKKAEEAVRESGEKLRSLFELSPLGIALTDMQGRYVEFNEAFRAICGYPAEELMTLGYWELTPRSYEMQEIAQLESLAKIGRYGPYEKEYMQKDGTLIPIQLVGTLITGKDGTQHIWSIVEDIRERKHTEAELKQRLDRIVELNDHLERTARDLEDQTVELEAQAVELEASQEQIKQTEVWYRSILHSAPDGMLVVDERGSIMLVNERLEAMFGYEHGELQGVAVEVLLPQSARERHVGMRDGFIARDDAYRQAAKTLFGCRKDGTEFPVDVSLSRLPEVEGMRKAICASVRDISERHAMEAAREAALQEVQHLAQLRSTFMAQMSHELRTPLNGILGYAQNLLQGDPLGEKQTAGLQIIQNSGEHLLTLINGILDHAAIEADKFELIPGDIELEPFLSTLIGIIRVRAEQKNLAFVCDADADLPAVVRGDAQRLRQVLLNLLSNAVKFTDHGQVILRVSCPAPTRLRFAVQDSGVGIVAEQLETIFIPFEQGGEVSRRAGGTGLGLSISRKLVKLMGGDIKVESQLGAGCTFSFEIDMAAADSGAEKVNAAALSEQAVTRVVQATTQFLAPPKAELDVLHGSALRGNMREITKHADRLAAQDSRYAPFAEQLHQLAKGFQTKALLSLIEQYRDEGAGQS